MKWIINAIKSLRRAAGNSAVNSAVGRRKFRCRRIGATARKYMIWNEVSRLTDAFLTPKTIFPLPAGKSSLVASAGMPPSFDPKGSASQGGNHGHFVGQASRGQRDRPAGAERA